MHRLGGEAALLLPGRHGRRVLRSPALAENPSHGTHSEGSPAQRRGEPEGGLVCPLPGRGGVWVRGGPAFCRGTRGSARRPGGAAAPGGLPPGLMCSSPGDAPARPISAGHYESLASGVRRRRRHRLLVGPGASRIWSTSFSVRWPVTLDAASTKSPSSRISSDSSSSWSSPVNSRSKGAHPFCGHWPARPLLSRVCALNAVGEMARCDSPVAVGPGHFEPPEGALGAGEAAMRSTPQASPHGPGCGWLRGRGCDPRSPSVCHQSDTALRAGVVLARVRQCRWSLRRGM